MAAVRVSEDPSFAWGQEDVLFSATNYLVGLGHRQYDVSPEDERFVMFRLAGVGASAGLVLVQHFFEELKRLVPK